MTLMFAFIYCCYLLSMFYNCCHNSCKSSLWVRFWFAGMDWTLYMGGYRNGIINIWNSFFYPSTKHRVLNADPGFGCCNSIDRNWSKGKYWPCQDKLHPPPQDWYNNRFDDKSAFKCILTKRRVPLKIQDLFPLLSLQLPYSISINHLCSTLASLCIALVGIINKQSPLSWKAEAEAPTNFEILLKF